MTAHAACLCVYVHEHGTKMMQQLRQLSCPLMSQNKLDTRHKQRCILQRFQKVADKQGINVDCLPHFELQKLTSILLGHMRATSLVFTQIFIAFQLTVAIILYAHKRDGSRSMTHDRNTFILHNSHTTCSVRLRKPKYILGVFQQPVVRYKMSV